jgi:hypothetical protein
VPIYIPEGGSNTLYNTYFENVRLIPSQAEPNAFDTLNIVNCEFTGRSHLSSGFINLNLDGCYFHDMVAYYNVIYLTTSNLHINNSVFTDNDFHENLFSVHKFGGLIYMEFTGSTTISNSIFCNNLSHTLSIAGSPTLNITNSIFIENSNDTLAIPQGMNPKDYSYWNSLFHGNLSLYNSISIGNDAAHLNTRLPVDVSNNLFWDNEGILEDTLIANLGKFFKYNVNGDSVDVYNNIFQPLELECGEETSSRLLVDAGVMNPYILDTDINGNPRAYDSYPDRGSAGNSVDIGPYESQVLSIDDREIQTTFLLRSQIVDTYLELDYDQRAERMTVADMRGNIVMQLNTPDIGSPIDISGLNTGVYMLSISDGNRTLTQKFIKR